MIKEAKEEQVWSWGCSLTREQLPEWENQESRSQCSNWGHCIFRVSPAWCQGLGSSAGHLGSKKGSLGHYTTFKTRNSTLAKSMDRELDFLIQILTLPLTSCVCLGQSLNL